MSAPAPEYHVAHLAEPGAAVAAAGAVRRLSIGKSIPRAAPD